MRFSHLLPFLFFVLFLLVCQHQAAAAGSSETLSDYEDEGEGEVSSHNARQDENLFIPHDTTEHLRRATYSPPLLRLYSSSHQAPFSRAALQNESKALTRLCRCQWACSREPNVFFLMPSGKVRLTGPEMKQERLTRRAT